MYHHFGRYRRGYGQLTNWHKAPPQVPLVPYNKRVPNRENPMTSKENLKAIIQAMPLDTPEIKHIILKSQINNKQKVSLSRNGNNG